jgi:hypothetical protein
MNYELSIKSLLDSVYMLMLQEACMLRWLECATAKSSPVILISSTPSDSLQVGSIPKIILSDATAGIYKVNPAESLIEERLLRYYTSRKQFTHKTFVPVNSLGISGNPIQQLFTSRSDSLVDSQIELPTSYNSRINVLDIQSECTLSMGKCSSLFLSAYYNQSWFDLP